MDLSGPVEVFSIANIVEEKPLFELVYVSEHGGLVRSNAGVFIDTVAINQIRLFHSDIVFLINGIDTQQPNSPTVTKFVRNAYRKVESICTVCTGLFIFANALPDEHVYATTHWSYLEEIIHKYPNVNLSQNAPFVRDDKLWSSAGISTAIDMALNILEMKTSRELTQRVAMTMVLPNRRKESDSQLTFHLKMQFECSDSKWESLLHWIQENLTEDLNIDRLANFMAMSPRNFTRRCKNEFSLTPKKLVDRIRIEVAMSLLRETKQTISYVAIRCGYKREENMTRAFLRCFKQSPKEFRRSHSIDD